MNLQLDTQLMPQYLPGSVSQEACTRVEMVAANDHRVIAFTLDDRQHLTLWLSTEDGFVRWIPIPVALDDGQPATVIDFDVIGNVGQGRGDNTVDLTLIAEQTDGTRQLCYWPGIDVQTSPEAWRLLFATARPLDFEHKHPIEVVRLGVLPLPVRRLITGSANPDFWWDLYRLTTDGSGHTCTGSEAIAGPGNPLGGPSRMVLAAAAGQRPGTSGLEDGAIVASSQGSGGGYMAMLVLPGSGGLPETTWTLKSMDSSQSWPPGLCHIQTVLDADLNGAVFQFTLDGDGHGNATMSLADVLAGHYATYMPYSVPDLIPAAGAVRVVPLEASAQRMSRFELMRPVGAEHQPAQLVLTTGVSLRDPGAASVPLFEDVTSFCACRCGMGGDEPTSLHVMVAYASGGLELFTQDSVSEQWQRFQMANDDVRNGWHAVSGYSTRILVCDERGAPAVGAAVALRPQSPCFALINGVATHLSPLLGQVVTADGAGVVNLVQPVSALGAAMIDVDVYGGTPTAKLPPGKVLSRTASRGWRDTPVRVSQTLNPMAKVAASLARVSSGTAIRDARASDGTQPFTHLPLERCNEASTALAPLMRAYGATLKAPVAELPVSVIARTRLHWRGRHVAVSHNDLPAPQPAAPSDWLPAVGDMLGYLWNLVRDPVGEVVTELEWLSNGLARLVLTIGDLVWRATLTIASQAVELIDWALQKSLGITLDDLVNWLGQVFDWTAILRTQKAIKHYVGLNRDCAVRWLVDSAPAGVACATNEVKIWLANLPDLDTTTRSLLERPAASGDDSEVQVQPPAAGPDGMWGQTQIAQFGGMATFSDTALPAVEAIMAAIENAGQSMKGDAMLMQDWLVGVDLSTLNPLQLAEGSLAIVGTSTVQTLDKFAQAMLPELAALVSQLSDAADASVQIPVLSALYSELINPGAELSLLDAITLIAAIGGHMGSELVSGEPLITAGMADRIMAATDLQRLLDTASSDTNVNALTAYNAISAMTSSMCKSLYLILWSLETWGGVRTVATVRWRVIADSLSWLIAFTWALVMLGQAERLGRDKQAYTMNVVYLVMALLVNRSKDAVDLRYASSATPGTWKELYGYLEVAFGVVLSIMAVWETALSVSRLQVPDDSDPAYWKSLIALSSTGMMSTGVYYVLSCERFTSGDVQLALKALRTVVNALRSTSPLVSAFLLFKCANEGWSAPGLMSD